MTLRTSILLAAFSGYNLLLVAQTAPNTGGPPASVSTSGAAAMPSATIRPSLDVLKTALAEVRLDKWKTSTQIRSVVESNLESIRNDVSSTLPSLLAQADAAPGSTAKVLPAYRNVEALYDVLLRVDAAGQLAAPADELSALDQALANLEGRRRALGDQLQHNADAQEAHVAQQEARVTQLQAALRAVPPPPPAPVPVKCPATPVKKKPTAKPAAKPTTPPANSPNSSH